MHKFQSLFVRRLYRLLLISLLLVLCCSCTEMQLSTFNTPVEHAQSHAEQLYINGDFETAAVEYKHIYQTALSPEDKNSALYGLTCCRIMLARTDDQLVEAIGDLQKWDANKGTAPFWENRHLLVLALKQQGERIEERKQFLVEREKELKAIIADQQIKISQMASSSKIQQAQIEKLQNQIAELEAIDKNVQDKRKPL